MKNERPMRVRTTERKTSQAIGVHKPDGNAFPTRVIKSTGTRLVIMPKKKKIIVCIFFLLIKRLFSPKIIVIFYL